MISLDQVYLLEQKVESAVAKIQQLEAENDALRNKCTELTNALSAKSEQLSSFEQDQSQIESGILKALDRLNSIENSVLKAAGQQAFNKSANTGAVNIVQTAVVDETKAQNVHKVVQNAPNQIQQEAVNQEAVLQESIQQKQTFQPTENSFELNQEQAMEEAQAVAHAATITQSQNQPNFDTMQNVFSYNAAPENIPESEDDFAEDENPENQEDELNPGFDIF